MKLLLYKIVCSCRFCSLFGTEHVSSTLDRASNEVKMKGEIWPFLFRLNRTITLSDLAVVTSNMFKQVNSSTQRLFGIANMASFIVWALTSTFLKKLIFRYFHCASLTWINSFQYHCYILLSYTSSFSDLAICLWLFIVYNICYALLDFFDYLLIFCCSFWFMLMRIYSFEILAILVLYAFNFKIVICSFFALFLFSRMFYF